MPLRETVLITMFAMCGVGAVLSQNANPPPMPFEDAGACPFEGCVYREWIAKETIGVKTDRRDSSSVAFRVQPKERVTAVTGIVVTIKPGRVQFREPTMLATSGGNIDVMPSQTLYLLTYQGEGFTKVWFQGKVYTDVDTTAFMDSRCENDPSRCTGKVIEQSVTHWWVQIRNRRGQVGWTRETEKFDGKDALSHDAS